MTSETRTALSVFGQKQVNIAADGGQQANLQKKVVKKKRPKTAKERQIGKAQPILKESSGEMDISSQQRKKETV